MITQRLQPTLVSELESQAPISTREKSDRTNILLSWGFIILFLGAAIGVVGKKLMHDEVVTVIGVLVSLAGMFLSVYPYVMLPPRSKHKGEPSSKPELQAQSEPQKSLSQEHTTEYVPSIAERTTGLLTNSVATQKRTQANKSPE